MYIISLTYTASENEVNALLTAHLDWLKQHYKDNHFIVSGRKEPPVGGIILAQSMPKDALLAILAADPFQAVASFDITEFTPSISAEGFQALYPH